jgi:hypothetical protein
VEDGNHTLGLVIRVLLGQRGVLVVPAKPAVQVIPVVPEVPEVLEVLEVQVIPVVRVVQVVQVGYRLLPIRILEF